MTPKTRKRLCIAGCLAALAIASAFLAGIAFVVGVTIQTLLAD